MSAAKLKVMKAKRGLELLPSDIKRHLLCSLDLSQLKALVRASARIHEQYVANRRLILWSCIEQTLGSATVDAYAVYLSDSEEENGKRDIKDFLKSYEENTLRRGLLPADVLSLEGATSIASLYFRYISTFAGLYTGGKLEDLYKATRAVGRNFHGRQQISFTPRHTETMRVTRAIYRFQLLCHLVGPRFEDHSIWSSQGNKDETVQALFDILKPWEVEELYSFYCWARDVYDRVLNEDMTWELHPDNPKFADQERPSTLDGAFDLSGSNREMYIEGITLHGGLPLLHNLLFTMNNRERLIATLQQYLIPSNIPLNEHDGVLGMNQQARSPPSKHRQMRNTPLPFRGDGEPDAPPLAWTMIWGGTYSDLYGWVVPDEIRRWGCVFWDGVRLERTGGADVLMRLWERRWDHDPRGHSNS